MTAPTLHYIHDPLCGWCYAVTPMVEAVAQAGIGIVLHGGGLWATAASPAPERRAYIRQSDARIAALTSMAFGPAYLDGLLTDAATVFWSRPTVGAVLAAGTMVEGAGLRIMHAVQHAHYVGGRRVVEMPVLAEAARSIGLAEDVSSVPSRTRRWTSTLREPASGCSSLGCAASPASSFERCRAPWMLTKAQLTRLGAPF
jgi:putative protein-disulfide isomerase